MKKKGKNVQIYSKQKNHNNKCYDHNKINLLFIYSLLPNKMNI